MSRPVTRLRERVRRSRDRPRETAVKAVVLGILLISAIYFLAPLYWLFSAAFRPPRAITYPPEILPSTVSLSNFGAVLVETRFYEVYLVNSLLVSIGTVVLTLAIAVPAGYALSQHEIKYATPVMIAILVVQMVPIVAIVIPLYQVFARLALLDTLTGIILANTILTVPISVWLLKGYYDTVPDELAEAARVGGASNYQTFRVLAPLATPGIGAAALFAFVMSWNQFVIPLTFASSADAWTFPVGLYEFITRHGVVNWGLLGAASLVAMLPVLVLFITFQRQFVTGLVGPGKTGG